MSQDQRKTPNLPPVRQEKVADSKEYVLAKRLKEAEEAAATAHERLEDYKEDATQ